MEKTVKFKLKNGGCAYYDSVDEHTFQLINGEYTVNVVHRYKVPEEDVEYFELYAICEKCKKELSKYCTCKDE